jgi:hypothetical protein
VPQPPAEQRELDALALVERGERRLAVGRRVARHEQDGLQRSASS